MTGHQEFRFRVGRGLRDARRARGWSQRELAEHAGVSRPTVARIEAGQRVRVDSLERVAGALGLSLGLIES